MIRIIFMPPPAPQPVYAKGEKSGLFDYFVLAFSWPPNWCTLESADVIRDCANIRAEMTPIRQHPNLQCSSNTHFADRTVQSQSKKVITLSADGSDS